MEKQIHVVSFDVPYPADYGGVIDVFVRLKALVECGFEITLHCFEYGRGQSEVLEKLVTEVHYYKRKSLLLSTISFQPMIVQSRKNKLLFNNLLKDKKPILFEGQHTTAFLSHPLLEDRVKIVRLHNVEHDYYRGLAKAERNVFKKMFFGIEAFKLKKQESVLKNSSYLCPISIKDFSYFNKGYDNVVLLPIANEVKIKRRGELKPYVFFHGNLSVVENEYALCWFLNQYQERLPYKLMIAGKSPSEGLKRLVGSFQEVELVESPSDDRMSELLYGAKVHLMITFQSTGVKQKLINSLATYGTVVANPQMVEGTGLSRFCEISNTHHKLNMSIIKSLEEGIIDYNDRFEYLNLNYGLKKQVEIINHCLYA